MSTTLSTDNATVSSPTEPQSKLKNGLTWAAQGLLGLLFLFAGASKFFMPAEEMTKNSPLPIGFLYFIGVCEVLGGLGLVLPGALKIRRGLTPIAAVGLLIIMLGAVVVAFRMDPKMAITPLVAGLLTAFVAYRRWPWLAG
jgi:uncharacterized membrane protein YphA (DoxX/SURF4 family)